MPDQTPAAAAPDDTGPQPGPALAAWIVLRSLRSRWAPNLLTVLAVALGTCLALAVPLGLRAVERGAIDAADLFDLIVTAEGSRTQAVMSTIYYQDSPTGNVPYELYTSLAGDARTLRAIPVALGDSYRGFPLVGTTAEYFDLRPRASAPPYFSLESGRHPRAPYEAVLGAQAARDTGLAEGGRFLAEHGLVASHAPETHLHSYVVVGTLAATGGPSDRAIFTVLESIWDSHGIVGEGEHDHGEPGHDEHGHDDHEEEHDDDHGHGIDTHDADHAHPAWVPVEELAASADLGQDPREVTAILYMTHQLGDLYRLALFIDELPGVQTVFPGQVLGQFMDALDSGRDAYALLANVILVLAILAVALNTWTTAVHAQRDLAVIRAVGVPARMVAASVVGEALVLGLAGIALGVIAALAAAAGFGSWLAERSGLAFALPTLQPREFLPVLWLLAATLAMSLLPAWLAARRSPLERLS